MMTFRKNVLFLLVVLVAGSSLAQQNNVYTYGDQYRVNSQRDTLGSTDHFAVYPTLKRKEKSNLGIDNIRLGVSSKAWHKNKWGVYAYPLLTQTFGAQSAEGEEVIHKTGVGIGLKVFHGKRFYAEWNLVNNYDKLLSQERSYANNIGVVSGKGIIDSKDNNLYQTNYHIGYLQYTAAKYFAIQLGRGKHFWGEGYRSMIWSDVSAPMNYLRLNTTFWKVKYTNLFTQQKFYGDRENPSKSHEKKYTTAHLLSVNVTKRLNLGIFETIVWNNGDSLTKRGLEPHYLNPIIFYRPVEFSLGSSDNALLGMLGSYRVSNSVKFYGQLLLDEFLLREIRANRGWWGNKYALQGGVKCYNLFGQKGLGLVMEGNIVRPFTYAHTREDQNYAHANEPLGNPLGANYAEGIFILNQSTERFYGELKVTLARKGLDVNDTISHGGDIHKSNLLRVQEFNNNYFQGDETNLMTIQLKTSYLIGRQNNIKLFAETGYYHASSASGKKLQNAWVEIGIRTDLFSEYRDYLYYK